MSTQEEHELNEYHHQYLLPIAYNFSFRIGYPRKIQNVGESKTRLYTNTGCGSYGAITDIYSGTCIPQNVVFHANYDGTLAYFFGNSYKIVADTSSYYYIYTYYDNACGIQSNDFWVNTDVCVPGMTVTFPTQGLSFPGVYFE